MEWDIFGMWHVPYDCQYHISNYLIEYRLEHARVLVTPCYLLVLLYFCTNKFHNHSCTLRLLDYGIPDCSYVPGLVKNTLILHHCINLLKLTDHQISV